MRSGGSNRLAGHARLSALETGRHRKRDILNPSREQVLKEIGAAPGEWDIVVVGGGATGLGTAVDAAARGYRTLLVDAYDFAKGTSSRSTKLVHGGVRYLSQFRLGLVHEALHERGLLHQNAPHLVSVLPFLIPSYSRG